MERTIGIGLLGAGTVGGTLVRRLVGEASAIEAKTGLAFDVRRVGVRNLGRARDFEITDGLLTDDEFATLQAQFMENLLQESAGFCACSMARRTLGIAGVADIRDIEDLDVRSALEITNLRLSKRIMAERNTLTSIDDLVELVRDFYAAVSL